MVGSRFISKQVCTCTFTGEKFGLFGVQRKINSMGVRKSMNEKVSKWECVEHGFHFLLGRRTGSGEGDLDCSSEDGVGEMLPTSSLSLLMDSCGRRGRLTDLWALFDLSGNASKQLVDAPLLAKKDLRPTGSAIISD